MTPLEKAQELIDAITEYASGLDPGVDIPHLAYTQIGTPVIANELFTVAVLTIDPHEQYGPTECNASQLTTFSINLARECSWTGEDDGTDDPEKIEEMSEHLSNDSEMLWNFAQQYRAYLSKQWSISFLRTGGLAITTMSFTIGVD